jgi:hypothetical protein
MLNCFFGLTSFFNKLLVIDSVSIIKKRLCAVGAYITENKQPGNSGCNGKGGVTHSLTPMVLYKVEDCYLFMLLLLEVSGSLCLGVRDDLLANYGQ